MLTSVLVTCNDQPSVMELYPCSRTEKHTMEDEHWSLHIYVALTVSHAVST
jgi:hypothetical protein